MPNYDYKCKGCGHTFELFQMMSAKVKRKCPKCKKNKLVRLISGGAGFILKGDGFYRSVDYINQKAKEKGLTTDKRRTNKGSL